MYNFRLFILDYARLYSGMENSAFNYVYFLFCVTFASIFYLFV